MRPNPQGNLRIWSHLLKKSLMENFGNFLENFLCSEGYFDKNPWLKKICWPYQCNWTFIDLGNLSNNAHDDTILCLTKFENEKKSVNIMSNNYSLPKLNESNIPSIKRKLKKELKKQ